MSIMTTISVIIPSYNSSNTLNRAIKSVSYADEIIVVDDASTDSTADTLDSLKIRYRNLHIIRNSENHGPAASRMAGIKLASCEWVTFLDADDYLSANSLPRFIAGIERCGVDIVQARMTLRIGAFMFPYRLKSKYDTSKVIDACLYDDRLFPVHCCGKFYRRVLLESTEYISSQTRWGEDRLFNLSVMSSSPRIVVDKSLRYNYVVRHSFNHHRNPRIADDIKEVAKVKIEWCKSNSRESDIPQIIQERDLLLNYVLTQRAK